MNLRQTRERAARPHESFSAWWWWWDCFDTQRWIHSMKLMMNRTRLSLDLSHPISFVGSSTVPEFLTISSSIIHSWKRYPNDHRTFCMRTALECLKSLLLWRVWRLKNYISPSSDLRPCFSHPLERPKKSERIPFAKKKMYTHKRSKVETKKLKVEMPFQAEWGDQERREKVVQEEFHS